ncbi:MAG: pitrilysin family protein, partial [Bacteroidota bacterium]
QIDEEVDFIGATLNTSANSVFASSLKKHTNQILNLMAEVILNPTFPQEELDRIKKQTISGIKSNQDDPNAISDNVEAALCYGKNHPYGEIATEETIQNITVEDCKAYYQSYFKPNIAYLAIVGDITLKEAKPLVEKYLGSWAKGTVKTHTYPQPERPAKRQIALVEKAAAVQTILTVTYPVPYQLNDPDFLKGQLMNQILGRAGSRLYRNLREDKGFTYGAYSTLSQDELIGVFGASASVRTAVTDSATQEFLYELERIREEQVSADELRRAKAVMSGNFARSMESPNTIASFAINTARYNLPDDFYATYLERLDKITIEEIQAVAQKHIHPDNAYIVAVGDVKTIEAKMKRFGEITQYDIYGNVDTGIDASLLKNTNVEQILNKYIAALGGREKLQKVKTVQLNMTLAVQGIEMNFITYQKEDKKYLMVQQTPFGEMKQIYDGEKAVMKTPQGDKPLEGEALAAMKQQAVIFPELNYKENADKYALTDVKTIKGNPAYEVTFTDAAGKKILHYFDVDSGLKVKTVAPDNDVTWGDYQEVEGVKFPATAQLRMQGQEIDAKIQAEVNPTLKDELFSTE